jgi:heme/copper-type cytochrome/quinol oxidase subunit 2
MLDFLATYILVPTAHAQALSVASLMGRINEFIINPLITLLFIIAFVMFVWGLFNFFRAKSGGGDSEDGVERGKRHIVWGIIGMVIMVSVFGIMQLLITSLGVQGVDPNSPEIGDLSGN